MRASLILALALIAGCGAPEPPAAPATAIPITPRATPAPGGGSMDYPSGTVIRTGTIEVSIGPGGRFSPDLVYLRPGTTTVIINRDTVPHTFTGFGGATDDSGPIQPGGRTTHTWTHPGRWTFHDTLTPNAPSFTVVDIPE